MAITKEPFGKGKTEDVNLVSAITKCYLTSEHPAFSWDQGGTLFEKKKQLSAPIFITKGKIHFVKLRQF